MDLLHKIFRNDSISISKRIVILQKIVNIEGEGSAQLDKTLIWWDQIS